MEHPVNYVVFDLETGGLKPTENPIVEIACCAFNHKLEDLKEYDTLIKTYDDSLVVTPGALKANGLTMTEIETGKDSLTVVNELIDFFSSLKVKSQKPVLGGHNIKKFDIPFLEKFFQFHKKKLWDYVDTELFDTLILAHHAWSEHNPNYQLGSCCATIGVQLINAHRALPDTRANAHLLKYFLGNLKGQSQGQIQSVGKRKFRESFQI